MKMILFCVSVVALLIGCASRQRPLPSRQEMEEYMATHDINSIDSTSLYDGEYNVGMSRDVLIFMLGEPSEVTHVREPWATQEHLYYDRGDDVLFMLEDDVVVGIQRN
ncbi:hypothetical protein [Chitinivibrio alkaliphilus]|uniref:Lipoprotein n=1 Tax=Chitinivibrio alkaliphilus ACht1 TaxID=1313304 RepID=U7D8B8_9BACT|nr:hypothetical protein [Chitinivibrio alkaliphilus]ERP32188.1 hypothetical protein CALK_0918 [Chitinivibrio alkaliphilus ACht1]